MRPIGIWLYYGDRFGIAGQSRLTYGPITKTLAIYINNSLVIYTRHVKLHKSVSLFVLCFKQEESKRFSNENHAVPAVPDWIF